jgi:hypothetical protein
MDYVLLFLVAGIIAIYFIARYERKNKDEVEDILRANKNVPPLFMLRSAELKVNAIKAALSSDAMILASPDDVKHIADELDQLMTDYKDRETTLAIYYTKLGALLIKVNELKGVPVEAY